MLVKIHGCMSVIACEFISANNPKVFIKLMLDINLPHCCQFQLSCKSTLNFHFVEKGNLS